MSFFVCNNNRTNHDIDSFQQLGSVFIRAVESEVPSSDPDSWKFRLSDSNSDSDLQLY